MTEYRKDLASLSLEQLVERAATTKRFLLDTAKSHRSECDFLNEKLRLVWQELRMRGDCGKLAGLTRERVWEQIEARAKELQRK